jgi:hypothetical protein
LIFDSRIGDYVVSFWPPLRGWARSRGGDKRKAVHDHVDVNVAVDEAVDVVVDVHVAVDGIAFLSPHLTAAIPIDI